MLFFLSTVDDYSNDRPKFDYTSHAFAGKEPDCRKRPNEIDFFDLPRETRDEIYQHVVSDNISNKGWMSIGPKPFKVGLCDLTAPWQVSVSLVSKAFAAELRPVFFHMWPFSVHKAEYTNMGLGEGVTIASLRSLEAFLHILADGAKHLRRFDVRIDVSARMTESDIQQALENCKGMLHEDILITIHAEYRRDRNGYPSPWDWTIECGLSGNNVQVISHTTGYSSNERHLLKERSAGF